MGRGPFLTSCRAPVWVGCRVYAGRTAANAARIKAKGGRIMGSVARSLQISEDKCGSDAGCGAILCSKKGHLAHGLRGSAGRTAANAGRSMGGAGRIMAKGGRIMGGMAYSSQIFRDLCGSDAGHGSVGPDSSGMDCGGIHFAECKAISNKRNLACRFPKTSRLAVRQAAARVLNQSNT
jgi:hypothetical protein